MIYHNIIRFRAIQYLGCKCADCGIDVYHLHPVGFDFHHKFDNKEFNISRCGKAWEKIKIELDKCALLCAACHRLRHINTKLWSKCDMSSTSRIFPEYYI